MHVFYVIILPQFGYSTTLICYFYLDVSYNLECITEWLHFRCYIIFSHDLFTSVSFSTHSTALQLVCQNFSQIFKVTFAIYVDKFFAYIFLVNLEVYIKTDNFMIAGAEFRSWINVMD